MRRPKCYKIKNEIPKDSVELYGKCFKNDQCKEGTCKGAILGITSGVCKNPRKKENVEEGEDCRITNECKKGLKCVDNFSGLKLGVCMEDKKSTNINNERFKYREKTNKNNNRYKYQQKFRR